LYDSVTESRFQHLVKWRYWTKHAKPHRQVVGILNVNKQWSRCRNL